MFINTFNEKRTLLSFLHYFAAAVGQIVQLWDPPPETLPPSQQTVHPDSTMALQGSQENDPLLQGHLLNSSPSAKTGERQGVRKRLSGLYIRKAKASLVFPPSSLSQSQQVKQLHFNGINDCMCSNGTAFAFGSGYK